MVLISVPHSFTHLFIHPANSVTVSTVGTSSVPGSATPRPWLAGQASGHSALFPPQRQEATTLQGSGCSAPEGDGWMKGTGPWVDVHLALQIMNTCDTSVNSDP